MLAFFGRGLSADPTTAPARPRRRLGRAARGVTAVAVLSVAGLVAGVGFGATPARADAGCSVQIVAHPDDDLFFQNPDVLKDIAAKRCASTVYVTSGDAGQGVAYSRNREKGVEAAYAKMAGVANLWLTLQVKVGDQTVNRAVLVPAPRITLNFLRLPDGNPDGSGTTTSGFTSLQQMYLGKVGSLATVDTPIQTYTTASLVKTLGLLLTTLDAGTLRTQDYLGDYDEGDHSDHITVARLASIAHATYAPAIPMIGYLGYPGTALAANVSGSDLTAKQAAFLAYAPFDTSMCQTLAACDARGDSAWLVREHQATEAHPARPITPGNVAPAAFLTYSSENWVNGQQAAKAVDGKIDGYPGDSTLEWATNGEGAGAWLQLDWLEPVQLDTVILYDRPNPLDWITGGTLTFSDGSTVAVPTLDNAGGPMKVTFPAKTTTSLKFTVTSVGPQTTNVGLAELQAWTSGSTPSVLQPGPGGTTAPCGTPTAPYAPTAATPATMPATSTNIAAAATVTASSDNAAASQTADKAVDGKADGYPGDYTAEWATQGCGAGSWLQLTWPSAVTLDHVVLYDRPNVSDQVTSGTLTFADGSTVAVPALNNDGSATTVSFPARSTTGLRFTVTGVSATTGSVGLAELEAWTAVPAAPVPPSTPAPAVDLAPTATMSAGLGTSWNGIGSWAQWNWAQPVTVGKVVITNPTKLGMGVTGATLTFADGSSVAVPAFPAPGQSITVTFPARSTATMRITVTQVQGLALAAALAKVSAFAA